MLNNSLSSIVKITNRCNLKCKYCYTPDTAFWGDMSPEILERFIAGVAHILKESSNINHFTFLWHGGEALLVGIDFFKLIIEFQNKYLPKERYTNLIQSNLTLLTSEYCEFFRTNNFRIGTSIDGNSDLHNANRMFKDGRGSFDETLKKMNLAKSFGLQVSSLLVLNRQNIGEIDSLYAFFKQRGIDVKIGSLTIAGQAIHNYDHVVISPTDYAEAIIRLFDLWYEDKSDSAVFLNMEDLVDTLIQNQPIECNHLKNCQRHFFSLAPNGEIYPCGRFEGLKELCYGNIKDKSLFDVLMSDKRKALISNLDTPNKECLGCEWIDICNGGCMHHAYHGVGLIKKDYYCEAYKKIFTYVKSRLVKDISKAVLLN